MTKHMFLPKYLSVVTLATWQATSHVITSAQVTTMEYEHYKHDAQLEMQIL